MIQQRGIDGRRRAIFRQRRIINGMRLPAIEARLHLLLADRLYGCGAFLCAAVAVLQPRGYEVAEATSGTEALERVAGGDVDESTVGELPIQPFGWPRL